MSTVTQNREVVRIERISHPDGDQVRMYLRTPNDPNDPAAHMGGEIVVTRPAAEEVPTGTVAQVDINFPIV